MVHPAPLDPSLKGKNVMVFGNAEIPSDEIVGNPIAENGETLFTPDPQGYNHDNIKVNPKHPRAWFFQLLMDSLDQDPSGNHFRKMINPYLNAPSNSEQD